MITSPNWRWRSRRIPRAGANPASGFETIILLASARRLLTLVGSGGVGRVEVGASKLRFLVAADDFPTGRELKNALHTRDIRFFLGQQPAKALQP